MHTLRYYDDGKDKDFEAVRTQIPITPTRALTYYNAQGLTLERVLARIDSITGGQHHKYRHKFGLLYTAFSRVKEFDHLRITHHSRELQLWQVKEACVCR